MSTVCSKYLPTHFTYCHKSCLWPSVRLPPELTHYIDFHIIQTVEYDVTLDYISHAPFH